MSFLDKAKDLAEKAEEVAKDHTEQIESGIDKAGDLVDKATHGRFSDQINTVEDKAQEAVGKLDDTTGPAAPSDPGA